MTVPADRVSSPAARSAWPLLGAAISIGATLFWLTSIALGMSERAVLVRLIRRRGHDVSEGA